jgi:hypothetical protein
MGGAARLAVTEGEAGGATPVNAVHPSRTVLTGRTVLITRTAFIKI